MNWAEKLKRLQEDLNLSADGLAGALGITTRTLADFMKSDGREPTGPVQKLVELMLGELDSQPVAKMSRLNLVIIHGDFRVAGGQNPVDAIVSMHSETGRQAQGAAFGTTGRPIPVGVNEFHYVTVAPERDAQWAMEGLMRRKIQPHFFVSKPGLDSAEARICYFTATTVWLVSQAMRRDLGHITLAADAKIFWPLAQELKSLAEVDVTFVRETFEGRDADVEKLLESIDIPIADPTGRKSGFVTYIGGTEPGKWGKIALGRKDQNGKPIVEGSELFFSWNHMRKSPTGEPELAIGNLVNGDFVSFGIGMNYKGPCATDVALIDRAEGAPPREDVPAQKSLPTRNLTVEEELVEISKEAIADCPTEDGWVLMADIGTRIKFIQPNFTERLQAIKHTKISGLLRAHPELFELSSGAGTRHKADIVRLKPKAG